MNVTLTNITTILAIVSIIVTTIFAIRTFRETRMPDYDVMDSTNKSNAAESDDYNDILSITHELEFNREKNKGEHFEDESVYLHRANQIRVNSHFFSWIKL